MIARILSGINGLFMLWTCLGRIMDPAIAAAGLAMHLLEGMGGNIQIGDFTSFFFTAGVYLGFIYVIRGFGIAAATHAAYDVVATTLLVSLAQ